MTSRPSSTTLTEMIPLLGSLARLIAHGTPPNDHELQFLLMGAVLESDPTALAEIQRWSQLLRTLQVQPTPTVRHLTVEMLLLRGVPEASALLAVATIADGATVLPAISAPPATAPRLQTSVTQLDFGTRSSDQPVSIEFEIQGGPGQIVVESDYVQVTPTQFGSGTTRVRVEVLPLAGGLLWTSLKLVTAGETVEMPVMAQWMAVAVPQVRGPIVVTLGANEAESGARLAAAIATAPAGASLHLVAGIYRLAQPLLVDKPITLTGEGMDRTRLLCAAEEYVVRFVGDGPFVMADLGCEHVGGPWINEGNDFVLGDVAFEWVGMAWANTVEVLNSELDFRRCRFTGAKCRIGGQQGGSGLHLLGQTRGVVAQCDLSRNATGVRVGDQAMPTLEANTCQKNWWHGIAYEGSAGGIACQNHCVNNDDGISLCEQAAPTLRENVCQQNGGTGIIYRNTASGVAYRNICTSNSLNGISLYEQAAPTLRENVCQQNSVHGISYKGKTGGVACQNSCVRNQGHGIYVEPNAQPTLELNICQQNQHSGIAYGSFVDSVKITRFKDEFLRLNVGIARQNSCSANEQDGIAVGRSCAPLLEANTCQQNKRNGILFFDTAKGTARQNMCTGNKGDGISVWYEAQPTLDANQCTHNGADGIRIESRAFAHLSDNHCVGNRGQQVNDQGSDMFPFGD